MIRLINLLFLENKKSGEVWRIDAEDSSIVNYGARLGDRVRYFKDEKKARDFAAGKTKSKIRNAIKKLPKLKPKPPERKQSYKFKND
jgi:hypothetical protein